MQVENITEKQIENYIEARIPYESGPLCGSKNFVKSTVGDCSKHTLYHSKVPPKMQWMNCEDCKHQFIDGYLTQWDDSRRNGLVDRSYDALRTDRRVTRNYPSKGR